ncbi:uncharacterized N-acetyltransferase ycf52 [Mercurialis annua]|uniref:uncharacterized N-acetyltransferase ycf52 n=1 Tax=Mercurialis annua TaxID=3986 RepID=UPI00215F4518|nr:uncharacterized N-acetyltransferase ycf52 [Mercurialis annua]
MMMMQIPIPIPMPMGCHSNSNSNGRGCKTSMEIKWANSRGRGKRRVPIYISVNPSHVNPLHLRDLFASCNHSSAAVDLNKLRLALSHTSLLVSVFANLQHSPPPFLPFPVGMVSPSKSQLIGFGRAVSDLGLTASIYDVVVIPPMRRMGIGKMIVHKIIRILTSKDIYDIAALCSADQRLFFGACGFGDDILGSTTMMYAQPQEGAAPLADKALSTSQD